MMSRGTVELGNRSHATAVLIFMHGLGDTAQGWVEPMQMLVRQHPHLRVVLPTAREMPVTLNGGMPMPAWYNIRSIEAKHRDSDPCDGLDDSVKDMTELIGLQDVSMDRIVLGGFSQGGAVAGFCGLQLDSPLAGVAMLSSYIPRRSEFQAKNTGPLLMCHGQDDDVVQFSWAQKSREVLEEQKVAVEFKSYPRMGHELSVKEFEDLGKWISKVLPAM